MAAGVDIGVWMSREVLQEKLALRGSHNPEGAWNLRRWPTRLSQGDNRLFVASAGAWCGYFKLSTDALYNPDDPAAPYTLLLDTGTWMPIAPVPVKPFRGFTYKVPSTPSTQPASEP